jgi:hypothetical protein
MTRVLPALYHIEFPGEEARRRSTAFDNLQDAVMWRRLLRKKVSSDYGIIGQNHRFAKGGPEFPFWVTCERHHHDGLGQPH